MMSLINPNQEIRHYGLTVSDDPTDKTKEFGISGDDFFVPFKVSGTTIFFKSRSLTRCGFEDCRVVDMTVDAPWNPSEVNISMTLSMQPVSTLESLEYRRVCAVEGIVTRTIDPGEESDLSTYDEPALI